MHNAAFRAARLDAVYLPLDAADVDDFAAFAKAIGLVGASVTIPFKVPLYEAYGRSGCRLASHRRAQHDSCRERPVAWRQHGRERIPAAAPGPARVASRSAGRHSPARAARPGRSRLRWRVERCVDVTVHAQPRAGRGGRDDRVRRGGLMAATGGQLGSSGELHAHRHAPERRRIADPARIAHRAAGVRPRCTA